jgi:hypothetical protein
VAASAALVVTGVIGRDHDLTSVEAEAGGDSFKSIDGATLGADLAGFAQLGEGVIDAPAGEEGGECGGAAVHGGDLEGDGDSHAAARSALGHGRSRGAAQRKRGKTGGGGMAAPNVTQRARRTERLRGPERNFNSLKFLA